ncbi:hypothetical protein [Candidatus Neptunichlamydia sp. REUL1]|uniref:hypothetical protein n=1 Tax=Candidatus Neptunichlamydia sp. REUL1 TaxID=3064277 RepID=UPI002930F2F9|nr:hypothetical protein [Candidatus Neptunochlamydia sp. REUL1]
MRIAFGVNTNYDGWDVAMDWTYQQIIDFAIGSRVEQTWINPQFKETFRMMFDIEWEAHLYPSYNHLNQTTSDNSTFNNASSIDAPAIFRPARGNLSLRIHYQESLRILNPYLYGKN